MSSGKSDGKWQGLASDSSHQRGKADHGRSVRQWRTEAGHRTSLPCVNLKEVSSSLRRLLKENGFGRPEQSQRRGKPSSRNGGTECSSTPSRFDSPPGYVAIGPIRATDEVGLIAATGLFRLRKLASSELPHGHRENRILPSEKGPQPRLRKTHARQLPGETDLSPQQLLQRRRIRPGEEVPCRDFAPQ